MKSGPLLGDDHLGTVHLSAVIDLDEVDAVVEVAEVEVKGRGEGDVFRMDKHTHSVVNIADSVVFAEGALDGHVAVGGVGGDVEIADVAAVVTHTDNAVEIHTRQGKRASVVRVKPRLEFTGVIGVVVVFSPIINAIKVISPIIIP